MAPRAVALGVVEHEGKILVEEIHGEHEKGTGVYYRPPGGGIEHGELSSAALVREFREELQTEVHNQRFFGVLENVFHVGDEVGHEIVFLYTVDLVEQSLYEQERVPLYEDGTQLEAVWVSLDEIGRGEKILYPRDLYDLLRPSKTLA